MKIYYIVIVLGDGIGKGVILVLVEVLNVVVSLCGF